MPMGGHRLNAALVLVWQRTDTAYGVSLGLARFPPSAGLLASRGPRTPLWTSDQTTADFPPTDFVRAVGRRRRLRPDAEHQRDFGGADLYLTAPEPYLERSEHDRGRSPEIAAPLGQLARTTRSRVGEARAAPPWTGAVCGSAAGQPAGASWPQRAIAGWSDRDHSGARTWARTTGPRARRPPGRPSGSRRLTTQVQHDAGMAAARDDPRAAGLGQALALVPHALWTVAEAVAPGAPSTEREQRCRPSES